MKNRIADLRTARGWSYGEVAKRVADDTSPSTIQKLEQGAMQLTPKWAEALARAFGVDPLEIYGASPARHAGRTAGLGELAEDIVPYRADAAETKAPPPRAGLAATS